MTDRHVSGDISKQLENQDAISLTGFGFSLVQTAFTFILVLVLFVAGPAVMGLVKNITKQVFVTWPTKVVTWVLEL